MLDLLDVPPARRPQSALNPHRPRVQRAESPPAAWPLEKLHRFAANPGEKPGLVLRGRRLQRRSVLQAGGRRNNRLPQTVIVTFKAVPHESFSSKGMKVTNPLSLRGL